MKQKSKSARSLHSSVFMNLYLNFTWPRVCVTAIVQPGASWGTVWRHVHDIARMLINRRTSRVTSQGCMALNHLIRSGCGAITSPSISNSSKTRTYTHSSGGNSFASTKFDDGGCHVRRYGHNCLMTKQVQPANGLSRLSKIPTPVCVHGSQQESGRVHTLPPHHQGILEDVS